MKRRPELLAPAGSLRHVRLAAEYGADAIYAGVPRWSLRVRGNGFTRDDFKEGIETAHALGKKFFAVLNVIPHMRRTQSFTQALDEVVALGPDALIMSDPGLIDQALERHPGVDIHLSVQNNTVNSGTVRFWQKLGVKRCILARELSLGEIEMIRNECPDMELEVFAHGALCIAVSGRCLISGMLAHRDANVGACTNSCRWGYNVRSISAEIEEDSQRKGQWMPIEEDEHGTYLLNSKDLCTLPVLKRLIDIGVDCLKIEGRSRSPFYSAAMSRAYRAAIDSILSGGEVPGQSWEIVNSIPSRGYTTGLLEAHRPDETQEYETNCPSPNSWQQVGQVEKRENGRIYVRVLNRFDRDSRLILFTPGGLIRMDGSSLCDEQGSPTDTAKGDGYRVSLECAADFDPGLSFLLRDDSSPAITPGAPIPARIST